MEVGELSRPLGKAPLATYLTQAVLLGLNKGKLVVDLEVSLVSQIV